MSVREYYVYTHTRPDTNAVFYVGKGVTQLRKGSGCRQRAYTKSSRNKKWLAIVAKTGSFSVEIVSIHETNEQAVEAEKNLIKFFGRKNLANMTDGGEGTLGVEISDSLRLKRSELAKRPRSKEWINSIRIARKNGGNGDVVKKGDKLPDWWCERISKAVQGKNNSMYGKTGDKHPMSKAVICTNTGKRYPSISAAAEAHNLKMKSLHNKLTGHRKNNTSLMLEVSHAS